MNIAYLIPSLANKGPVIVVQDLCRQFVAWGHRCKVFYFDDITELEMPCETERIRFRQKIDFTEWDVVHSHMLRPDLWVWWHKPWFGKPRTRFVTTLHNPISYQGLRSFLSIPHSLTGTLTWNTALSRIDTVVALNSDTQSRLPSGLRKKSVVIFNGRDIITSNQVPASHAEAIDRLRKRYTILGCVCGMSYRKGIEQVVRALEQLPQFAFVGVGDGPQLSEWKKLAERLKVADRCCWVGYTPDPIPYYSKFDIFVLPSRSEGFPLALIEASAYGLPLVLSDIPILRAIADQDTALFFRLDSIKDFVRAIEQAALNKERYAARVRKYYTNHLTADKMAARYLNLYDKPQP